MTADSRNVTQDRSTDPATHDSARARERTYLIALIFVAIVVLAAGILLRPKQAPPAPVSEAEAFRLQMQAQRRELERRALFFSTQARELVSVSEQARTRPASVPVGPVTPGERLLVVVPASGEPLWIDTTVAGELPVMCNGMLEREVVISSALAPVFSGGGAFNLDGGLVGIVADCGDRNAVLRPDAFPRQAEQLPARRLYESAGLRVRLESEPDLHGARVLEVRQGSACASAGVRAGDLIRQIGNAQVTSLGQFSSLVDSPSECELVVIRDGREVKTRSGAPAGPAGVKWRDRTRVAQIASVVPGSPAESWGFRPGDVVLQAGKRRSPRRAEVESVITSRGNSDIVVLRRGSELLLEQR